MRNFFHSLLDELDRVFDQNTKGYNGEVDPFEENVNMAPVEPPQRKGCIPQYAYDKRADLQQKFDNLEKRCVFKRHEDVI